MLVGLHLPFTTEFMLHDTFGREHTYLRISLTDTCNYRCLYCLPNSDDIEPLSADVTELLPIQGSRRMSADEIVNLATLFVDEGITKIRLTGGEPLLRHDAGEIIMRLAKLPVELCLTTNGSRLKPHLETIERAQVKRVNISLDTLRADVFKRLTGHGDFETVRTNIDRLLSLDTHVSVNMVVMKDINHAEIPDFIAWTRDTKLLVRFIEFMPFPGNHWRPETLINLDEILEMANRAYPTIEKLPDAAHDTDKKYRIPGFTGSFSIISTMSAPFCSGCNRLRLSADGKMRNCLFASQEIDLVGALRRGEDPRPLIHQCVQSKAASLGGHNSPEWALERTLAHERSMMAIGG